MRFCFFRSGVECKDEILSCTQARAVSQQQQKKQKQEEQLQQQHIQQKLQQERKSAAQLQAQPPANQGALVRVSPSAPSAQTRPQPATAKLFAPRTEEMSKGFLMFSEEEPGLTSKSRPFSRCIIILALF